MIEKFPYVHKKENFNGKLHHKNKIKRDFTKLMPSKFQGLGATHLVSSF